jgi:hypothetical protein
MGKLDELKNKAKDMVSENRDRIEDGLDKAGDMINQRTGGKHGDKIDQGLEKAKQGLDRAEGKAGDESAPAPQAPQTPEATPEQPPGPPIG